MPMHSHRFPHVIYVIDGGIIETTGPDGDTDTHELMTGETL